MRERINLTVGQKVILDDVEYEFLNAVRVKDHDEIASDDLQFRDSLNHAIERLTNDEFVRLVDAGRVILPTKGEVGFNEAPEEPCAAGDACPSCSNCKDRKMRANRLFLTQAFDETPVSKTDKSLEAFIAQLKPSVPYPGVKIPKAAVLRRLLRERGAPGDRRPRQMADRRRAGIGKSLLHPVAQQVIWDKAERYWNSFSHSAKDVYAEVKTELGKRNDELADRGLKEIRVPCRQTVWRMLIEISLPEIDRFRSTYMLFEEVRRVWGSNHRAFALLMRAANFTPVATAHQANFWLRRDVEQIIPSL